MCILKNETGNVTFLDAYKIYFGILRDFGNSGPFELKFSENVRIERLNGESNIFGAIGGINLPF